MKESILSEDELRQIHAIQSESEAHAKAERLPSWVKCMYCGCRPSWGNLLGEVVPKSSALACQVCLKERGKIIGLNAGTIMEIAAKGDKNGPTTLST